MKITLDQIKALTATKADSHYDTIRAVLSIMGIRKIIDINPKQYEIFYKFLNTLKILILFIPALTMAQTQASAMVGYKSAELSFAYEAENELIFGAAVSATATDVTEKRANRNDRGTVHQFNGSFTPAVFGLIGGKFDELSIIGKIGGAYVDQSINGKPTKDLFLALGIAVEYKISDAIGLRGSYDSVAGPMAGVTFHFNN